MQWVSPKGSSGAKLAHQRSPTPGGNGQPGLPILVAIGQESLQKSMTLTWKLRWTLIKLTAGGHELANTLVTSWTASPDLKGHVSRMHFSPGTFLPLPSSDFCWPITNDSTFCSTRFHRNNEHGIEMPLACSQKVSDCLQPGGSGSW